MTKFICETKNLSKKYKDFYALKNVNLTIPKGEIYGLVGISIVQPIFDLSCCRLSLCPNRIISPSLLKLRPVNNLIKVVFPAPFSPTRP